MKRLLYDFSGYNGYLFTLVNKLCASSSLLTLLSYVSAVFDIEHFAVYYILAVVIGYLYLKNTKALEGYYDFMVKLGIGYATFGFVYAALKFNINMPRPFCSLNASEFTTIINTKAERCLSSFPSSHTGLCALLVMYLWPYMAAKWKVLAVAIIIVVGISRISLAMHYPADILYSLPIAYLVYRMALLVYNLFKDNIIKWVKNKFI